MYRETSSRAVSDVANFLQLAESRVRILILRLKFPEILKFLRSMKDGTNQKKLFSLSLKLSFMHLHVQCIGTPN